MDIYVDCLQLIDRKDQSVQGSEPLKNILEWGVGGPDERLLFYTIQLCRIYFLKLVSILDKIDPHKVIMF